MQLWPMTKLSYILDSYVNQDGCERLPSMYKTLYVDSVADRSEQFEKVPIYLKHRFVYKQIRTVRNGSDLFIHLFVYKKVRTVRNGSDLFIHRYFHKKVRTVRNGSDLFIHPFLLIDQNGLERFRSIYTSVFINRSERFGTVPIYL